MSFDTKGIRQGEGNLPAIGPRHFERHRHRLARRGRVPKITFKVGDPGLLHQIIIDILPGQVLRCAQKGVHRPLRIGGDEDEAARRRVTGVGKGGQIINTRRADIMREDLAELVIGNPPDEGG